MAGVPSINGQEITSSNAFGFCYDIYQNKYPNIKPNGQEADRCKHFLTEDQIQYCINSEEETPGTNNVGTTTNNPTVASTTTTSGSGSGNES